MTATDFATPWVKGGKFSAFLKGLPAILAGVDLAAVIDAIAAARGGGKTVILAMGAHVIKVGLSPVIVDLMQRGIVSAVAMNGAGIIHDTEIAIAGQTSEDVACALDDGSFGMARETGKDLNRAIRTGDADGLGLGAAVGRHLERCRPPKLGLSVLAAAWRLGLPATVHVAIGTDIIHMHPDFDAAANADVPGAVLLADRQLKFLDEWAIDYSGGTWMKVLLSQTIHVCASHVPESHTTKRYQCSRSLASARNRFSALFLWVPYVPMPMFMRMAISPGLSPWM